MVLVGEVDDTDTFNGQQLIDDDYESFRVFASHAGKSGINLIALPDHQPLNFQVESFGRLARRIDPEFAPGIIRVPHDSQPGDLRNCLTEQLDDFRHHCGRRIEGESPSCSGQVERDSRRVRFGRDRGLAQTRWVLSEQRREPRERFPVQRPR